MPPSRTVLLLTFSNLYPSDRLPRHGIFVEERLRHLVQFPGVRAEVVALRPAIWKVKVDLQERRNSQIAIRSGIRVHYVAVPTLPKISNWIDPWLWARTTCPLIKQLVDSGGDDVVLDAHFLYPDGVAATLIGKWLDIPVVISARGSDVNIKAKNLLMRQWIKWSLRNSHALITVSEALAEKCKSFSLDSQKVVVIPNGVDLKKFRPCDREVSKERFKAHGPTLVSVGNLIRGKGHHLAIESLTGLKDCMLLVVGRGPEEHALRQLAIRRGVQDRVQFLGEVQHEDMPYIYSAADVLVLLSSSEGMPNVLLESIACGTKVIASDVGGVKEIVTAPEAGIILKECSVDRLIEAVTTILDRAPDIERTVAFAQRFSWSGIVEKQVDVYREVVQLARADFERMH